MQFESLEICVKQYKHRFDRLYSETQKPFWPSKISIDRIRHIESAIGVVFPKEFVQIITMYDFTKLDVGQLIFCYGEDYRDFEIMNCADGSPWWISGKHPRSLIAVAGTTDWTILLDVTDGSIHGFENPWAGQIELVAPTFELLLRASCTAALQDGITDAFTRDVLQSLNLENSEFWLQALRGWA